MSKIMALDIGDQWTGIALSDITRIFAKPYKTVATQDLEQTIQELIAQEAIQICVIGYPKTMRGTESEQTKKIVTYKEMLEKKFSYLTFVLWDERLSSKRASEGRSQKTKEDKLKTHAIAAAFILDSYLSYLALHQ